MRWSRFVRPSPALVVSMVALLVALGGTSYAAFSLPKNSVGNKQLKNNSVSNVKLRNGSVGNAKLKPGSVSGTNIQNGTITGSNLNLGALGTVPSANNANHATNADNATKATTATAATTAGTAGTANALASVSYQVSAPITSPACGATPCAGAFSDTAGSVTCPAGMVAVGGGVQTSSGGLELNESEPASSGAATVGPDQWFVFVDNFTPNVRSFNVVATCITANAADNPNGLSKNAKSSR